MRLTTEFTEVLRSRRGQRFIHGRKNEKEIFQARGLQNRPHLFLHSGENKNSAVILHVSHSVDQNRQTGAINIIYPREVHHQARRLLFDQLSNRLGYLGGNMEIDWAFQWKNIARAWERHIA